MKRFALLLIVIVGLFVAWWQWGTSGLPASPPKAANSPGTADTPLPPSAVLSIDPKLGARAPALGTTARRGQLPPAVSPLLADYLARRDFPVLFNRLAQMPDNSEALFLRAQILERCARITDASTPSTPAKSAEERRAVFVARLQPDDRDTPMRIAAYDTVNADPCGELRSIETSRKELADLRIRATEMKDAAALARDLNCEIYGSIDRANGGRFPEINDSRFERIRTAIASRNPIAVRTGVGMLANTFRNGAFRIGPDGKPVDPNVMSHVANLMACQYGADCNTEVLRACVNDGKCNVNSYDDYLAYYQLSPNDAQVAEQYRVWLTQMIDSGDFSRLELSRGEQPMDSARIGSYFSCAN